MSDELGPPLLDICPITVACILTIGPNSELLKHQPNDAKAKKALDEAVSKLKSHLAVCEKCSNELRDNTVE